MQNPFTFIHSADLHLGTPFKGVCSGAPEVLKLLRESTLLAFGNLVDLAISEKAAFVLIAGDLFDGPEHGVRSALALKRGFSRLNEAGIEVFIVLGNHDPLHRELSSKWQASGGLGPNVKIFGPKAESVFVVRGGDTLAVIHGVSYSRREETADLASLLKGSGDIFNIGLVHATVGGADGQRPYAPSTMETLKNAGIDYWALGHVHTRALLCGQNPVIAYPGNAQALSPRENGPRGALVVSVDAQKRAEPRFVPLDAVRQHKKTIRVEGVTDPLELHSLLAKAGEEALAEADGRPVVLTTVLTGATPLYADLAAGDGLSQLIAELREESGGREPLLWWNEISSSLAPPLDLGGLKEQGGFEAELIALCEELAQDPESLEELAARCWEGLYKKQPRFARFAPPPPGGEELRADLLAARDLALGNLTGGGE